LAQAGPPSPADTAPDVFIQKTYAAAEAPAPPDQPKEPVQISAPLLPAPAPPPAPPAAPAAAPVASPPSRWLLMRALQGTWEGSCMDTERLSVYGWTEMSFTASTADDSNAPMSWNDQANKFLLQQNWVRIDRPLLTTGTTTPSYGGRIDMIFGTDYRFTLPQRGLLFGERTDNHGTFYLYGFDPVQFYGEAYYPTIGRGLDVKVGRFYTPYGVESIEAVSTPLVSRSYIFSNGSPFTHTGVLSTLTLTPVWTVQAGLVLGSDLFISEADRPTFVGSLQWTQPATVANTGRNVVKATTVLGSANYEQDLGVNNINIFDVVWTHTFSNRTNNYSAFHPEWALPIPNPGLSYQLETLYGYQNNAPLPDGSRSGFVDWLGVAQYLNYQFTPRLAGVARFEVFDDFQGQRTGAAGVYTTPSVCLIFKPVPWVVLRPELRYDHNDETPAFDGHHGLATATIDCIVRW
jgi:hypothetical protein